MPEVKATAFKVFDGLPAGDYYGWSLAELVSAHTGRRTYPETILHYMREYADASGARFSCLNRSRSLYHFIPGIKLEGAIE